MSLLILSKGLGILKLASMDVLLRWNLFYLLSNSRGLYFNGVVGFLSPFLKVRV